MYTSNMKDGTGLVYDGKQEKRIPYLIFMEHTIQIWEKNIHLT